MRLYLKNTLQGLIPLFGSDRKTKDKLKLDKEYLCEIRHPRNYLFHKKFFALLNLGFDNTRLNVLNLEAYRFYVLIAGGVCTEVNGVLIPKSIAFANMDEQEFEEVYNIVLQVIALDIDVSEEEIKDELLGFM